MRTFALSISWILAGIFWVLSLTLPAFLVSSLQHVKPIFGVSILFSGFWGLLALQPAWFANPLLLYAAYKHAMAERRPARKAAIIGFFCSLAAFATTEIWENEGSASRVVARGLGFYLWLDAIVIGTILIVCFPRGITSKA